MMANAPNTQETSTRWFVLQAEDPALGCSVLEARFEVANLCELRIALAGQADDDADLRHSYVLDGCQLRAITKAFEVAFDAEGRTVTLSPWHSTRDTPYLIHTGFELFLMLKAENHLRNFPTDILRSGSTT